MRTTFFGLNIGLKALQANQQALNVTGHNIANASNQAYSRQEVVLAASAPYTLASLGRPMAAGQVGTGVDVVEIRRARDTFLDNQYWSEFEALGRWETRRDILEQVEVIFNEPSSAGLRTVLDQFWASLQELATYPESPAVRATVIERAGAVTQAITHTYRELDELKTNINDSIKTRVDELNILAREISSLNDQILKSTAAGDRPNDLLDRRTELIDRLSRLVDIQVTQAQMDTVNIYINGMTLVDPYRAYTIRTVETAAGYSLVWEDTNAPVTVADGTLRGVLDLRDVVLPDYLGKIKTLTETMVNNFNAIHKAGYDLDGNPGLDFFNWDGADPQTLAVNPALRSNPRLLAAATSDGGGAGAPGDGSNALAMAQLKHAKLIAGGTMDDFFRATIGQLGVQADEAKRMADNQDLLVGQVNQLRQGHSGVSLDEEMANLIRFQHGYEAAARLITAVDEMIDTIINRMGIVGR